MMTVILQSAAAGAQGQQGGAMMWLMLLLMIFVMWAFMIRPQNKQRKALEEMRASLKKGDKVVTAGGIHGTIAEIDDPTQTVLIKVDGEVKIRVDKSSLQKEAGESAPASKQ